LILKGPVTNNKPDGNWPKKTTLLPENLPASKIKTVPGVRLFLNFVGLVVFFVFTTLLLDGVVGIR